MVAMVWCPLPAGLDAPGRELVELLRAAKDSTGLTLTQISAHTYYSRASWERWLNGKRVITAAALTTFAGIAGMDEALLLDLLGRSGAPGTAVASHPTPRHAASVVSPGPVRDGGPSGPGGSANPGASADGTSQTSTAAFVVRPAGSTAPSGHTVHSVRTAHEGHRALPAHRIPGARPVQVLHTQASAADLSDRSTVLPSVLPARPRRAGCQLPPDTRAFAGRAAELTALLILTMATSTTTRGEPGATVCAIDGMAGVGKTALAVRAARLARHRFPDGQIYLDLRGHALDRAPLRPEQALASLLAALGIPAHTLPTGTAQLAALYRRRLAETRTLIVLDDAMDSAQVRSLLPAEPGCVVLVTGRRHLVGLDDAQCLPVAALPEPEAVALLHKVAGSGRLAMDDPAVARIAALCGGLPLALRIAASRLRHRRALTAAQLAEQLSDESTRLARLVDDERSVAAAFDASYRALSPAERNLFQSLGGLSGEGFGVAEAAELTGLTQPAADRLLEALLDRNLLIEDESDRFRMHSLLRAYAR